MPDTCPICGSMNFRKNIVGEIVCMLCGNDTRSFDDSVRGCIGLGLHYSE